MKNTKQLLSMALVSFALSSVSTPLIAETRSGVVHKDADNTAQNVVDRDLDTVLPEDQSNEPAMIERTANIRKQLMNYDGLSTSARNIKIVTVASGEVVLRGPVSNVKEKQIVEDIARKNSGSAPVKSFIEVAHG